MLHLLYLRRVLCHVLHRVVHCVLHPVVHFVLHPMVQCVLHPVVLCVLHPVVHCVLHPVVHCVLHPVVHCVPCSLLAVHVHCRGDVRCALHSVLMVHPGAVTVRCSLCPCTRPRLTCLPCLPCGEGGGFRTAMGAGSRAHLC